jgi:hypothetical protein
MVNTYEILGKGYKYIWLTAIAGSILVIIESLLNVSNVLESVFSILIGAIVSVCAILSQRHIHGSSFLMLVCASLLLLSPIGFTGFEIGYILMLLGALISTSGGLFTYSIFFVYLAIGAVVVDLIIFFFLP